MSRPTVSVVVPTLGDPLLADALESLAHQSYEPLEVVVVDGSTDGIPSALRERIDVYDRQEPRGLSVARNRGIDLASGDYVGFLDEDDLYPRRSVAARVALLEGGYDVVYGDWYEVDASFAFGDRPAVDRRRTAPPVSDQGRQHVHQFLEQGLRPSAVMARAECFESHRFDPERKLAEDFHLWVRLMREFRVGNVDEPVLYYRVTRGSLSRADRDVYRTEKLAAIDDLVARYPELEPHADRVKAREWYLHGREKLAAGDESAARKSSIAALRLDPRARTALLLCIATFAPAGTGDRVFSLIERVHGAVT